MSGTGKRSFTSFVRPAVGTIAPALDQGAPALPGEPVVQTISGVGLPLSDALVFPNGSEGSGSRVSNEQRIESLERTRVVTPTGRVRTYTASRNLPGVTLRLTEQRWERLKMLSIQERRPIQEILGEALDDFMKARGLPW
jgi:hypothetical protein